MADLREKSHALLVWAEGYTRGLTWDEKIAHIETALRAVQREAIEAAAKVCEDARDAALRTRDAAARHTLRVQASWQADAASQLADAIRALLPPTPKGGGE